MTEICRRGTTDGPGRFRQAQDDTRGQHYPLTLVLSPKGRGEFAETAKAARWATASYQRQEGRPVVASYRRRRPGLRFAGAQLQCPRDRRARE